MFKRDNYLNAVKHDWARDVSFKFIIAHLSLLTLSRSVLSGRWLVLTELA